MEACRLLLILLLLVALECTQAQPDEDETDAPTRAPILDITRPPSSGATRAPTGGGNDPFTSDENTRPVPTREPTRFVFSTQQTDAPTFALLSSGPLTRPPRPPTGNQALISDPFSPTAMIHTRPTNNSPTAEADKDIMIPHGLEEEVTMDPTPTDTFRFTQERVGDDSDGNSNTLSPTEGLTDQTSWQASMSEMPTTSEATEIPTVATTHGSQPRTNPPLSPQFITSAPTTNIPATNPPTGPESPQFTASPTENSIPATDTPTGSPLSQLTSAPTAHTQASEEPTRFPLTESPTIDESSTATLLEPTNPQTVPGLPIIGIGVRRRRTQE